MQKIIRRSSSSKIVKFIENSSIEEVLIVTGARQVGKTTTIEQVLQKYPKAIKINLEEEGKARERIDHCESFQELEYFLKDQYKFNPNKSGEILFIDEAQESDKLGSFVRFMKEKWKNTKVILSGSSMNRLFRDEQKVPVGRYRTLLITPLSFKEFVVASGRNVFYEIIEDFEAKLSETSISLNIHNDFLELIDQYLTIGGLPSVVTSYFNNQDHRELLTEILRSQEDDFVRKSSIGERYLFKAGLKGIANYLGSSSKNTHVHEKQHIAEKVISVEKFWCLIYEVEQRGINSTSSFYPKRYLYDLGIAQEVRDMPFPQLSVSSSKNPVLRTQLGGLFENMLLLQIISYQNSDAHISGWKKNSNENVEVDFVWRVKNEIIPIECKASLKVSSRSFSSLRQYLRLSNKKLGILVSAAPYSVLEEDGIILVNLPIYLASGESFKRVLERYG